MERNLALIIEVLQRLIGLHRQLLEAVRAEREALVAANLKGIQEATYAKEALVESIKQQESLRLKAIGEVALILRRPMRDLTLPNLVIAAQGTHARQSDQLQSAYNALKILVQRIGEQNDYNRGLVERLLGQVQDMKRNVLGESVPRSTTYTAQGQRSGGPAGARLISKEA